MASTDDIKLPFQPHPHLVETAVVGVV